MRLCQAKLLSQQILKLFVMSPSNVSRVVYGQLKPPPIIILAELHARSFWGIACSQRSVVRTGLYIRLLRSLTHTSGAGPSEDCR